MLPHEDAIVNIPENRLRYFGGPGKMLLPSPATIAALIQKVPQDKLITTDLLRSTLTNQFEVDGTCPVTTQKALKVIARVSPPEVAYWRVIKQNGGLMAYFPHGVEEHAELLKKAGFTIDTKGKAPKVYHFEKRLVPFG